MPLRQVAHTLPALAYYDYSYVSSFWMDFRVDPGPNDVQYDFRRRMTHYLSTLVLSTAETPLGWPSAIAPFPATYVGPQNNYLDVDTTATAHHHSHSVHVFYTSAAPPAGPVTSTQIVTVLSSPRSLPL